MKILVTISISILLTGFIFAQNNSKDKANSLIFKSFEQKNGFCRTGLSFNYFASTLGYSFDFFINRSFSVDFAYDGVYSFKDYYSGQSFDVKFWPIKIRTTNKLYPFVGLGYSYVRSSKHWIKSGSFYDVPIGVRYFLKNGLQISYNINLRHILMEEYFFFPIENLTLGVGWRF